jgi:hypothetical protein
MGMMHFSGQCYAGPMEVISGHDDPVFPPSGHPYLRAVSRNPMLETANSCKHPGPDKE